VCTNPISTRNGGCEDQAAFRPVSGFQGIGEPLFWKLGVVATAKFMALGVSSRLGERIP
jgi:hypothetical protein